MAEEQSTPAKPARDVKKLFGFAFFGLNVAALALGSFLVYRSTLGVKDKVTTESDAKRELASFEKNLRKDPVLYTMKPFTTNLNGVPRRLVRVKVNLEMLDQEGFEEVIRKEPEARDAINRILNSKSFSDVESVQGKLELKNQIIAALNGDLKKGIVKNVYFSDFVVQ